MFIKKYIKIYKKYIFYIIKKYKIYMNLIWFLKFGYMFSLFRIMNFLQDVVVRYICVLDKEIKVWKQFYNEVYMFLELFFMEVDSDLLNIFIILFFDFL